jgi:glutaminyl-peptide cyclotransferase
MKSIKIFCLLVFFNLFSGCSQQEPAPQTDSGNAMKLVDSLVAFGQRYAGSQANKRQAEFIVKTLHDYGCVPKVQVFTKSTVIGKVTFRNIEAVITGKEERFVIIGSHYDTKMLDKKTRFEGANDGASSTALLLEMIRSIKLSGKIPPVTIKFVFFDGEECFNEYSDTEGLYGSRFYAENLRMQGEIERCSAVIILDMIGDKDLNIAIPSDSDTKLASSLFAAAERLGFRSKFDYYKSPILDDHVPFQKLGIPSIDIIDFEFGPGNCYWHTSEDNRTNISEKSMKIVGDTVLEMVWNCKF